MHPQAQNRPLPPEMLAEIQARMAALPPSVFDETPVQPANFAQAVALFFERSQMTGADVPVYNEVMGVLNALRGGELQFVSADQAAAIRSMEARLRALSDEHDQLMEAFHHDEAVKASVRLYHKRKHAQPAEPDADGNVVIETNGQTGGVCAPVVTVSDAVLAPDAEAPAHVPV